MNSLKEFISEHKKLVIILGVVIIFLVVIFSIRSVNLRKKAAREQALKKEQAKQVKQASTQQLQQDKEEVKEPKNQYKSELGLDSDNEDDSERVVIEDEDVDKKDDKQADVKPVQTDPKYKVDVNIFGHTGVPNRNMDGSSCREYFNSVSLADFGTYWGTSLTDRDFKGHKLYLIGVEQNPKDTVRGDLESTGWLISRFNNFKDNDAFKFTNLHVIGSLSDTHVALLCSYDWYSAWGMQDTLVVFEDISNTLKATDFRNGDIFSATVFKHNMKILRNVNGQRVIVVQYATYDEK